MTVTGSDRMSYVGSGRRRPRVRSVEHRGFVVVAVLALFAVAMMLFAGWSSTMLSDQRQLRRRHQAVQAQRLSEAGVRRGLARWRQDPQYRGETWRVTAAELGQQHAASVRIQLQPPAADELAVRVIATADYPAGTLQRGRRTVEFKLQLPPPVPAETRDST